MATFTDTSLPRKRITTYGKASRKRISDYSAPSPAPKSESFESRDNLSPLSRSPSVDLVQTEREQVEDVRRRYTSKTPLPDTGEGADLFDVPSSEDELSAPTPKRINKTAARVRKPPSVSTEDGESRKKVKLSPTWLLQQKPPHQKLTKRPLLSAADQAREQPSKPLRAPGDTAIARPKPSAVPRTLDRPRTPQKKTSTLKSFRRTTPNPKPRDVEEMNVNNRIADKSPKGLQLWNDLLEPLDHSGIDSTMAEPDAHPNDGTSLSRTLLETERISSLEKAPGPTRKPPGGLPRQRLIDSLVDQGIQGDEESDDSDSYDQSEVDSAALLSPVAETRENSSKEQRIMTDSPGKAALPSSQASQSIGPKFTYSRQRSMLSEKDIMKELAFDIPLPPSQTPQNGKMRRAAGSTTSPLMNIPDDDDDDMESTPGIRSVHELRQAGANNRFLDEIEDLLDRIGTPSTPPSSMRRAGLLDLASKMKNKEFERKFRANGVEQRLFLHLYQEEDVVSGFVMVSILITLLVDASMPHVAAQLRRHGITTLLIRLLDSETGIVPISNDRKTNLSKIMRGAVSQLQDFLLKLPVWEELQPQAITPRTAALKCLELMIRQTREAGDAGNIMSSELTTKLFSILKSADEDSSWNLPNGQQAIDFCLMLSSLESHSITARSTYDESTWISDYLPVIADALQIGLSRPADGFGLLQVLILRLTLNVTNNNPKASDVFATEPLIAIMGQTVITKFKMISRFLTEEQFSITMDHLILVLGVMINFAEWSSLSRGSLQALEGKESDPLDGMTQLFIDNQSSTSEAESVEESQKNVAFGYLSVLLGYLALQPSIAERIRMQQPRKNIQPLLASIEEFIGHHKTVDNLIEADEEGHSAHTGLTERLENLVARLGSVR